MINARRELRAVPMPARLARQEAAHESAVHLRSVDRPRELSPVLSRRDPELIRRLYPWLALASDRYFRAEVEGLEHLSSGRVLYVSTHNGSLLTPDLYCLMVAYWRQFGLETPVYGLMHGVVFHLPGLKRVLTAVGAVEASRANADLVLDSGFPLLVCPGGDVDALKPSRDRHRITFGNRRGFIRLALRHQVPVVPVVSVGAHEVFWILNDGRWLAEVTGAARYLRIKSIPLSLSFPFGLTPAGVFAIPLPSKIRIRVLPPMLLGQPPEAAEDPEIVEKCFDRVTGTMQRALDELASKRRFLLG